MPAFDPQGPSSLQGQMARLFDEISRRGTSEYDQGAFAPPVDILEIDKGLVLRAELPGVAKDDVDINVENNVLIIRGDKKPDPKVPAEAYRRNERVFGRFIRSFTLPRTIDANKIGATMKDGVLEVTLPIAESAMPRRVQVS